MEVLADRVDLIYFDKLNLKPGLKERLDPVFRKLDLPNWLSEMDIYYRRLKVELSERLKTMGVRHVFVY